MLLEREGLLTGDICNIRLLHELIQLPVSEIFHTAHLQLFQLLLVFLILFLHVVSVGLLEIAVDNLNLLLYLVKAALEC